MSSYLDEIKIYDDSLTTTTTTGAPTTTTTASPTTTTTTTTTPEPTTTTTTTTTPAPTKKIILSGIVSDIETELIFRNFMITTKNDIEISANENVNIKCYGYTLISDNLKLYIQD
jgi:hypothetical protein